MRPVLDVGKQDDLTLDRREASERREQSRAEVGAFEIVAGRVSAIRGHGVLERDEAAAPDGSKPVQRPSVHNGEEPRREPGGLTAGGELFVGVHEGLLRNVVGLGGVTEDGERARECGAPVPAHQIRKRVLFSRQRAVNEVFVALLGRHASKGTPAGDET